MKIMVTGAAGFIGAKLCQLLLDRGDSVIGVDNLNDYYDVRLKCSRLELFESHTAFELQTIDISDREAMSLLFSQYGFDVVVNLAAQAGVRYSIENPATYIDTNLVGFGNILEGCRASGVKHLVYASSSSVYGANTRLPFSEHMDVDHPLSLYGATKRANELMAHVYSHLFALPSTGLRFFTVYGPWGRPDMALFKFTRGILAGEPIPIYGHGQMIRDFTYIDDIVRGVIEVMDRVPPASISWSGTDPDPAAGAGPFRLYNIGNSRPVELLRYIEVLEECLGKKAIKQMLPMQDGDVRATNADVSNLERDTGYRPTTPVEIGIRQFVDWYSDYYQLRDYGRSVSDQSRQI